MTRPSLTWRGKLGWIGFFLLGFVLFLSSFFVTGPLGVVTMIVVAVLVLAQVAFTAGLVYYPYRNFRGPGPNVRAVDEPERSEYAQLCADSGAAVRDVWVTDDLRHAYGFAQVLGVIPGNRHLFLDAGFFDLYTPDERRAVVIRESHLASSYYFYFEQTLAILAALAYFGIELLIVDTSVGSRWPFVPELLGLLALVGGVLYVRRSVYAADRSAAEQTNAETVSSGLQKLSAKKAESKRETVRMKLFSLLWTRPSPEKRIEHLQNYFGVEGFTTGDE